MPVIVIGLVLTAGCASQKHQQSDFSMDVDDNGVRIAVSKHAARAIVEDILGGDLQCDGELDDPLRSLLLKLEDKGPRARAAVRNADGTIEGLRRGGTLDLRIRGEGSGRIDVTMPWKLAQCLLGRTTTIDEALASSIRIAAIGDDGKRYTFQLQ